MAPSRHDWKIVDWDVKPQHNQPNQQAIASSCIGRSLCVQQIDIISSSYLDIYIFKNKEKNKLWK